MENTNRWPDWVDLLAYLGNISFGGRDFQHTVGGYLVLP